MHSTLSSVELQSHAGKTTVILTLTGHEMALAADEGRLNQQEHRDRLGFLLTERSRDKKSLIIKASATPDAQEADVEKKAANIVEAVYDMTQCRLGGMTLKPEASPILPNNASSYYSPAVMIQPVIDRFDKDNFVGRYCMEVIRRKYAQGKGLICDPRADENCLRLLQIHQPLETKREALHHADQELHKIEEDFGIYYKKPMNLMLTQIRSFPVGGRKRKQSGIFIDLDPNDKSPVTIALLQGTPDMLDKAQRILPKNLRQHRHGDYLEVGNQHLNAANLVAAVHSHTHCHLPMDINAASIPHEKEGFLPCLDTEVWDDVPVADREATADALSQYVGLQVPDAGVLRVGQARIIMNKPCTSEKEAIQMAEGFRDRVTARLKRGEVPHLT